MELEYDVALSFAGEDRPYVDAVAEALAAASVSVFYDRYETVGLWGKDLYQHLSEVYSSRARYCVAFISRWYASKLWPRHELDSALGRAMQENREYILPVRFDDTDVPGIEPLAFIDLRGITPQKLAALIIEKIGLKADPDAEPPPEFDREELRAFLLNDRLVRDLDRQIASFTASGRVDERRDAPLDAELAGLRLLGIRTLDALEKALGSRRKLILQWAAEALGGTPGPVGRGVSLTYLAYAALSEWRDIDRLERYVRVCRIAPGEEPHAVAARIIETHIRLTR